MPVKLLSKYLFPALLLFAAILPARGQEEAVKVRYGHGLSEHGSDKPAYTIYTNPGPDCSKTMNISWATPLGTHCAIELTDKASGRTFTYDYEEGEAGSYSHNGKVYSFPHAYRCETFNDIPSKLCDGASVNEMHVFDKHSYELFDLEPNRHYSYRIVTIDPKTNRKEHSDPCHFRTAGAKAWKAAVIGDFHHYSPLWHRVEAAMNMLDVINTEADGFDWVISTGDQCAYGGSYNFWTELSEQPNFKNYMWASVQGNHDHMAANKETTDNFFRDSHYFPHNGYPGQEGCTYWFRYGDVLFLMLNSEAMHTLEGLQEAEKWMEKVVRQNPSKYIVVVEHYQWLIGTSGTNSQLQRFYKTFDRLGVDLAISGHNHVYLRTAPLREMEPVEPSEGTFYVVNSSSDNERGREMKRLSANSGIIEKRWSEGPHTVGGMLMDVNPQRIKMTLYNRHGEVEDSFTVPAKR